MSDIFRDRREAGQFLAGALMQYAKQPDVAEVAGLLQRARQRAPASGKSGHGRRGGQP